MNEVAPNWLFVVNVFGWLITFLLGLVITLLKMESARQERRIGWLEEQYRALNNQLLGQYLNKDEIRDMMRHVQEQLTALNAKFDVIILERREQ